MPLPDAPLGQRIQGPEATLTKRAYARYGNDRFLSVEVNPSDFIHNRETNVQEAQAQLKQVCMSGFEMLGRTWALVVPRLSGKKGKKSSEDKKNGGESVMLELLMFATHGPGLETIRASDVREWHVPTMTNQKSVNPKCI